MFQDMRERPEEFTFKAPQYLQPAPNEYRKSGDGIVVKGFGLECEKGMKKVNELQKG